MGELIENQSLTEIANSALAGIGDGMIESLYDDNNGKAKICRLLLNQCMREVQGHASACWSELEAYEELVRNQRAYCKDTYTYNLPRECLSVKWVRDCGRQIVPYRISLRSLKTPREAKYICYVRFSDNPEDWSTELKSCVTGLLSAKLVGAVLKDYSGMRQAVEGFWQAEFPRWAGNRNNASNTPVPGMDAELSAMYGEDPHTILMNKDW